MIYSPEFWSREAYRAKIKTPFEVVVSAVRALGTDVDTPMPLVQWSGSIGEPLYQCQPPTGYADKADAWVNTGALLNRLNFSLTLAGNKVRGVAQRYGALLGQWTATGRQSSRWSARSRFSSAGRPGPTQSTTLRKATRQPADCAGQARRSRETSGFGSSSGIGAGRAGISAAVVGSDSVIDRCCEGEAAEIFAAIFFEAGRRCHGGPQRHACVLAARGRGTPIDPGKKQFVVLFQRGAADGLNIVVPYGEPNYYRLRPSIAIPQPGAAEMMRPSIWTDFSDCIQPRAARASLSQQSAGHRARRGFARSDALAFRCAGFHGVGHARRESHRRRLAESRDRNGTGRKCVAISRRGDGAESAAHAARQRRGRALPLPDLKKFQGDAAIGGERSGGARRLRSHVRANRGPRAARHRHRNVRGHRHAPQSRSGNIPPENGAQYPDQPPGTELAADRPTAESQHRRGSAVRRLRRLGQSRE